MKEDLSCHARKGAHHGLRLVLALAAPCLGLAALFIAAPDSAWRSALCLYLQVGAVGLVVGALPGTTVARDKAAGGLELFLLTGRRPWEIVLGKMVAGFVAGVPLLIQTAMLTACVLSVSLQQVARAIVLGIALALAAGAWSCWYELATGAPRPAREAARGAPFLPLPFLVLGVAWGDRLPWWQSLSLSLFLAAALFSGLACIALRAYAPSRGELDEDVEAPRRRLSSRGFTGRAVDHPVLEASRIPVARPWPRIAVVLMGSLAFPAALLGNRLLVSVVIGSYLPTMAVVIAYESLALSPAASGFAVLAATPMSSGRILAERILGKLSLASMSLLPLFALAIVPPMPDDASLAAGELLGAYTLFAFGAAVAMRSRGGAWGDILDLAAVLVLVVGGIHVLSRVTSAWCGVSTSGLLEMKAVAGAYVMLAAGAALLAVSRFEAARRCVA